MQRLRPLVILLLFWGGNCKTMAEPPSVGASVSSSHQVGTTHFNLFNQDIQSKIDVFTISPSTGLVNNRYRLRGEIKSIQRDLTSYLITEADGTEVALSSLYSGWEQSLSLGFDRNIQNYTLSLDLASSTTQTPLAQQQAAIKIQHTSFLKGATLTLSHTQAEQIRPLSYYVDPDTFESKAQATSLNPKVTRLVYDQIISEMSKASVYLVYGERPEDRPPHFGLGGRGAYSFKDGWALHGGMELLTENRQVSLNDSRGYLDLLVFDIGIAIEANYNWTLSANIGTSVESETARGVTPQQIVGSDSFDLLVEYRKSRILLFLQARLQESNTKYQSTQIAGGATWEI